MQLIDDKKKVLKLWSVQAGLASAFFTTLDILAPVTAVIPSLQGILPDRTFLYASLIFGVLVPVLRLIKQPKLRSKK